MCADPAEENALVDELERDAVVVARADLPDPRRAFHSLQAERGVSAVGNKQSEGSLSPVLQFGGQAFEVLLEAFRSEEDHQA